MTASFLLPAAKACQKHPLHPKWLIAPNLRVANQWKEQICRGGVKTINLHSATLKSLVHDLIASAVASKGLKFATAFQCSQIMTSVVTGCLNDGKLNYFSEVNSVEQLANLLFASIQDLRLAGLDSSCLVKESIEAAAKAHDLEVIYDSYVAALSEKKLIDYAECLVLATKHLKIENSGLPADLIVVLPRNLNCSRLENEFLECLKTKAGYIGPPETDDAAVEFGPGFISAVGEVNEIQTVLRRAFHGAPRSSLDQIEVLHADYSTYVPLLHELLTEQLSDGVCDIDALPISFGEGLACIYSRPGRALRSWLRWVRADFLQAAMVNMVREGLVGFGDEGVAIGYASMANRLRKLPIGFGGTRYEVILNDACQTAAHQVAAHSEGEDSREGRAHSKNYDFGLATFRKLKNGLLDLIQKSPSEETPAIALLDMATVFLNRFARTVNKFDHYAKAKLLDDIAAMKAAIEEVDEVHIGLWEWLEALPVESRILASGPRPGCIHVDHVAKGGHSGRANTFIVGLDDSRFPTRGGQDPLLLDFERQAISQYLETSGSRNSQSRKDFRELLTRLSGKVTFTFATQSLAGDRGLYPSSALLETYRQLSGQPRASIEEFLNDIGTPKSFCPDSDLFTSASQWWQAKLAAEPDEDSKAETLEEEFSHLVEGRVADEQRATPEEFTQYDGLVPEAGKALDPTSFTANRTSPSRLETFGTCPRKFFFRYGLGVYPPDEHVVDHEQWLDPLQLGTLLHDVFEDFLRELTKQNRAPEVTRDQDDLTKLLRVKMATLKETVPPPNQDAFERQKQRLEKTCEIFLRNEEEHCRSTGSVPWILEASVGLGDAPETPVDSAEPVSLTLSDGRAIKVGGRIDRIDQIQGEGSHDFAIWDYKTGSAWGFDPNDPFKQGRKLQPYLYAGMLRHRLAASVSSDAKVNYFGYFFPSPKTEGLRLQWTTGELASGDAILRHICDAISAGAFVATNERSDCNFCDYLPICGEPFEIASTSLVQLETSDHESLDPIRALRGLSIEETPPF